MTTQTGEEMDQERANHRKAICTVAVVLALLSLLLASPANACECASTGPPCGAFWNGDPEVFVARVTAVHFPEGPRLQRRVTLQVAEVFRGDVRGDIDLLTGSGGGDCGYPFAAGETYLV